MRSLFAAFCISISLSISAQKGFKTSIDLHPFEPNGAYQVQECNGRYILNGQYFDTSEEYWLPFVAEIDLDGNIIHKSIFTNDTTFGLNLYDRSFCDSDSYFFTGKSNIQAIFKYEFDVQLISIIDRFNFAEFNVGPSSYLISDDNSTIYYCGRNISTSESETVVIMLSESDTVIYRHGIEGKNLIARNMRFNSTRNIVVAAEAIEGWLDSTYILIFDPKLNLLSSTSQTPHEANFSFREGLEIDHLDNIICTGNKVTRDDGKFIIRSGAVKFDK